MLEIMIVVILISLLASMVGVRLVHQSEKAKIRLADAAIHGSLGPALQYFYLDNNFYPTTQQGLEALVEKPTGAPEPTDYDEEGYLDRLRPDPWGMPYQYACPGMFNPKRFDLWSMGPDRQPGTADDICNWEK